MARLSPPHRERIDDVHNGTTGLLRDGAPVGMNGSTPSTGSTGSTGRSGLGDRLRAQVDALTAAADELCEACADLADALRPAPGDGMDDPLTVDLSDLHADQTATLLDEAAGTARNAYRLLTRAYAALDDVRDDAKAGTEPSRSEPNGVEPAPGPAANAARPDAEPNGVGPAPDAAGADPKHDRAQPVPGPAPAAAHAEPKHDRPQPVSGPAADPAHAEPKHDRPQPVSGPAAAAAHAEPKHDRPQPVSGPAADPGRADAAPNGIGPAATPAPADAESNGAEPAPEPATDPARANAEPNGVGSAPDAARADPTHDRAELAPGAAADAVGPDLELDGAARATGPATDAARADPMHDRAQPYPGPATDAVGADAEPDGAEQARFERAGFERAGFDRAGFDRAGFERAGFDRAGFERAGFETAPPFEMAWPDLGSVDGVDVLGGTQRGDTDRAAGRDQPAVTDGTRDSTAPDLAEGTGAVTERAVPGAARQGASGMGWAPPPAAGDRSLGEPDVLGGSAWYGSPPWSEARTEWTPPELPTGFDPLTAPAAVLGISELSWRVSAEEPGGLGPATPPEPEPAGPGRLDRPGVDTRGGLDAPAPLDLSGGLSGGLDAPAAVDPPGRLDLAGRSDAMRLEPVAARFWDEAVHPPAEAGEAPITDAPITDAPITDAPITGSPLPMAPIAAALPLHTPAAAAVPPEQTWPDAFVELPRRPHELPEREPLRSVSTGRHSPPALTVVPDAESAPIRAGEQDRDPQQVGLAALTRQVEAARRHLQAAVVVAHDTAHHPRLDGLLGAVEQALAAVTELAQEGRETLTRDVEARTFPGEARFLCAVPWERAPVVAPDPYGADQATSSGLARLLCALGYEAHPVTSSTGVVGVQVRSDRYAAHVALVEPAGGGRQRWSGALEWTDATGASRTWAETLGPVELDEPELAHRVDDLLRRYVGPLV